MMTALLIACKQNNIVPESAAVNVVNASPDLTPMTVNFTLTPAPYYQQAAVLGFGGTAEYSQPAGTVPITVVSGNDTTHHVFQGYLKLAGGHIYSFYVYGNLPNVDTLFLEDHIPVHKDSVSAVRFINLSPDSGPVSINVQGSATSDFQGIAFKNITAFKTYPATGTQKNNNPYTFEIRDASGTLLTTGYWNFQFFQNNTMVISGSKSNNTVQVTQVNNY